jgi:hypothetical protein
MAIYKNKINRKKFNFLISTVHLANYSLYLVFEIAHIPFTNLNEFDAESAECNKSAQLKVR